MSGGGFVGQWTSPAILETFPHNKPWIFILFFLLTVLTRVINVINVLLTYLLLSSLLSLFCILHSVTLTLKRSVVEVGEQHKFQHAA